VVTKQYITFSVDCENGEVDLTEGSKRIIESWAAGPLFAADVLQDIAGISQTLHCDAYTAMIKDWSKLRTAAGHD